MHMYDRRVTTKIAGVYQNPMVNLVRNVDKIDAVLLPVEKALEAVVSIEKLIKSDAGGLVSALPGLNQYAPQQHIDRIREALLVLQTAARDVGTLYEDMNAAFLRMGLK